jgi:hypothetical protein
MKPSLTIDTLLEAQKKVDSVGGVVNTIAVLTARREWFEETVKKIMDRVPEATFNVTQGMISANGIRVIHVRDRQQVRGLRNWEVMLLDDAHEVEGFEQIMYDLEVDRATRKAKRGVQ